MQRVCPPFLLLPQSSNRFPTLSRVINSPLPAFVFVRSSIPEQTLRQSSALPSNVTSGLKIPLPFPPGQRRQILPLPSQKIRSAPFPSPLSLALDLKSQNPSTPMKKRVDPLGILQFPRTCPVSHLRISRDGTTAAPPCSL